MKADYCSAIFSRGKHIVFMVSLMLTLVGIASRIDDVTGVAAQEKTKINQIDGLTYVWIPPGTFQMGCSPDDSECTIDEKPAHKVTLTRGFWIGRTLVTQAAYKKVVGFNPSDFAGQGDQLPIEQVSWDEAQAYCKRVNMRLPTEAEWEYAARGGSATERYGPLDSIAWFRGNDGGKTHEVGQKLSNDYGLYDMLGGVWEWVADWIGPYGAADAVDPKGPQSGQSHVLRGGSWTTEASSIRVSTRYTMESWSRYNNQGIRCAGN